MANPITKHPRIGDGSITVDDAIPSLSITTAMLAANAVTGAKLSAAASAMRETSSVPTVPTAAGTTEILINAPAAGSLLVARVAFKDALAASDTNWVQFNLKNKTQASADMLDTTATNSSKVTGGTALSAYTSRSLALNGTPANLMVAVGDVLAFQIVGTGTLANTLTEGNVKLVFSNVA